MKFSLTSRPLSVTLESLFHLESPPVSRRPSLAHRSSMSSISDLEGAYLSSSPGDAHKHLSGIVQFFKAPAFLRILERTGPSFHRVWKGSIILLKKNINDLI